MVDSEQILTRLGEFIRTAHPKVLAVTGPHSEPEVMVAVHAHLPKPHDPFIDLVPAQGVKLTPKHYAYLKISEGCNQRCTFCIIPSMRGDLVSRLIGEVMNKAENLLKAGVRELLVISQDTSAYGGDVKYRTGFWRGRPLKTRMTDLVAALGALAAEHGAWVRLRASSERARQSRSHSSVAQRLPRADDPLDFHRRFPWLHGGAG